MTARLGTWLFAIVFGSTAVVAASEGAAGWSAAHGAMAGALFVSGLLAHR